MLSLSVLLVLVGLFVVFAASSVAFVASVVGTGLWVPSLSSLSELLIVLVSFKI